jgi:signal transduction histidine kinase
MRQLIDNLLDVGKIEAGIDMDMDICQPEPLLQEVLTALKTQALKKSITLAGEFDNPLPLIMVNATRIQQVIYNLTDNAIKYTDKEGQVTVKAFQHDGQLRIQVIDTGVGIPPADQPHVFEKFHLVKSHHQDEVRGTGLGLAITKSIIDKHNGRIWLESVPGEGSTFTVALPVFQP